MARMGLEGFAQHVWQMARVDFALDELLVVVTPARSHLCAIAPGIDGRLRQVDVTDRGAGTVEFTGDLVVAVNHEITYIVGAREPSVLAVDVEFAGQRHTATLGNGAWIAWFWTDVIDDARVERLFSNGTSTVSVLPG